MERRAILAAVLMAGVLFLYVWVQERVAPVPPARPEVETQERGTATGKSAPGPGAPAPAPGVAAAPPAPAAAPAPVPREVARPPQTTARVDAPLYRAVVSSEGGKLQDWTLRYRGEKGMVLLGEQGPQGLWLGVDGQAEEVVPFAMRAGEIRVGPGPTGGELAMRGEVGGLVVEQAMGFRGDTFGLELRLRVQNPGPGARRVTVGLPWTVRVLDARPQEKFPGQHATELVWSRAGHVERREDLASLLKAPGERVAEAGAGDWIGLGSTWYLAALVPRDGGWRLEGVKREADRTVTAAARAAVTVEGGTAWEGRLTLYVGPKEYDRLRALGMEGTLNFGGFPVPRSYGGLPMEWIGVPILRLMNWLYGFVANYGVVIIGITVLSKALFYPLTVKSMRSMKAMQSLQPQVNALRSKYRSDAQRLQKETMDLYRKHRVNPVGGCLPMVAQVPIFYALYLALSVSVELQNAPFLCFGRAFGADLWVCDLAAHDPTYVLPILMGVSMFVQQKMTPVAGDPRQAKMMLIMPFVFTFMFLNLPSGLVLYWLVSNILQIAQQWYLDRTWARSATPAA